MQTLHEKRLFLDANLERVWELITSLEERKRWQPHLSDAKLLYGNEGCKGAKIQLNYSNYSKKVIEHVRRGDVLVRLNLEYKIEEQRCLQVFNLSRIDENRTSLLYYCQQESPRGWLKIFSKTPLTPSFLDQKILEQNFERLVKLIRLEVESPLFR